MKKINFRFSYFLLIGMLGYILQIIAFFSFSDVSITSSNLTASSKAKFNQYMANNYILIAASLLIIAMFIGYLIGKKKNKDNGFNGSAIACIVSESLIVVSTLVYLIFTNIVRVKMFSSTTKNVSVINTIILFRFVFLLASYATTSIFAVNFYHVREHSKLSKSSIYVMSIANVCLFVIFGIVMVTSLMNDTYKMLTNIYDIRLLPPYEKIYPTGNGFTLAQLTRMTYIFSDAQGAKSIYTASAGFAIFTQIMYLVCLVCNLYFCLVQLIESYDIDRDSNLMGV